MYEEVFGFQCRPFTSTPFVQHYVDTHSMQQATDMACQAIDRARGPVVVVGQPGTGKSLLLAVLADHYHARFRVVNLSCARLQERRDLLQAVLFELKQPYMNMSEGELRLSLMDFLKPDDSCPNGVLLLVDEGDSLPVDLMDELRLVTNFVRDGQPRVRLVIAGGTQLEETLNAPRLESFSQRIAARCFLQNLNREETRNYIRQHIQRAGGNGQTMFDDAATDAIHEATGGRPRFINQLCEQAMILAATRGMLVVESKTIPEAWADVQNLPCPIPNAGYGAQGQAIPEESAARTDESWTVIEFGALEGTDSAELPAEPELPVEPAADQYAAADAEPVADQITSLDDVPADQAVVQTVESSPEAESTMIESLQQEQDQIWRMAGQPEAIDESNPPMVENAQAPVDQPLVEPPAEQDLTDEDDPKVEMLETPFPDSHLIEETSQAVTLETVAERGDPTSSSYAEPASFASAGFANPFDESFEIEERVGAGFADFLSSQNSSSLDVTPEDLDQLPADPQQDLIPLADTAHVVPETQDDVVCCEPVEEPGPEYDREIEGHDDASDFAQQTDEAELAEEPAIHNTEMRFDDPSDLDAAADFVQPIAQSIPVEVEQAAVVESNEMDDSPQSVEPVAATESVSERESELADVDSADGEQPIPRTLSASDTEFSPGESDTSCETSWDAEEVASVEASTSGDSSPSPVTYHTHPEYDPSDEVQRRADQILESLRVPDAGDPVSCETPATDATETEVTSQDTAPVGDDEVEKSELSESQKILNEILEQKQLLNSHPAMTDEQEETTGDKSSFPIADPPSYSMVTPLGEPNDDCADDSDMIMVNKEVQPEAEASSLFPNTDAVDGPVSTGRAERMDYQRLFDQLRNITGEQ